MNAAASTELPDHDQAEQLAEMGDRHDPQIGPGRVEQGGQPDRAPAGPADAGLPDDHLLALAEPQPVGSAIGHADGSGEHAVGSGPDLGAGVRDRGAQRFGQLQQQLVHRYRAAHPGAEGVGHLFGRAGALADDCGRNSDESVAHRQRQQGNGDRRGQARQQHAALVALGNAVDTGDDDQIDHRDQGRDSGDRDRLG